MAKKWDFFQLFLATNIQKLQVVAKNNLFIKQIMKIYIICYQFIIVIILLWLMV